MYEIEPENVYEIFYKDTEIFYFSNYSKESNYCNNTNNLIVGKMKNKTCYVL